MSLEMRPLVVAAALLIAPHDGVAGDIGLTGPTVTKLAWNTRSLAAHDIDGDGRTDLAVVNNDRARIEILYQRRPGERPRRERTTGLDRWQPVLEDAPFRRQSLATGIRMFALAAGDLDGDGLADLAYTGSPDGLTIRYQQPTGVFQRRRVLEVDHPSSRIGTLAISDLDGDGRPDLTLLTEQALLVFGQDPDGELVGPRSYAVADADCHGLRTVDADADGRLDLLYQVAQSEDSVRIRFGLVNGGFGPEQAFRIEPTRGTMAEFGDEDGGRPVFVRIQAATGLLELLALDRAATDKSWLKDVRPRLFSSRTDPKSPASYALDDFDGDGRIDIAIADGRGARTWLLLQADGTEYGEAVEFPSLADVRSLASGDRDGDGRAELFLASPKDRTIAWTTLSGEGRMEYPRPLPTRGRPFAVAAGDLDRDGDLEVAYSFEDQREHGVTVLNPLPDSDGWQETTVEIDGFDSAPREIRVVDANHDLRLDLAVFGSHEGLRLLLQLPDGSFTEASVASGFRQGLVDGIEPSAFTTGDVNGDGSHEILVASEGYARSLKVSPAGTLEVVDQYNARASDTRIAAALVVDLDRDDISEVVLVEKDGGRLQVLRRRHGGVFRHVETVPISAIDLVEGRVVDLAGDGNPDILLLGSDRLVWLPLGGSDLNLVSLGSYESDLRDTSYNLLGVGDLDSDGSDEIVAVDGRDTQVLEVLRVDRRRKWHSELHFTVFDVDPHYEGQRGSASEPREMVIADVTGDSRDDIVLLVHDRVLVYPQR